MLCVSSGGVVFVLHHIVVILLWWCPRVVDYSGFAVVFYCGILIMLLIICVLAIVCGVSAVWYYSCFGPLWCRCGVSMVCPIVLLIMCAASVLR